MKCAWCNEHIDPDDVVMVRGTAYCPACRQKSLARGKWVFCGMILFIVLVFVAPILVFFMGCFGLAIFSR